MKRVLSFVLLLLVFGCGAAPAAAQSDGLTVSFETAVYSISKETFLRTLPEPASQEACGPDEYATVCAVIKNPSGAAVTLQKPYIRIDGGEELHWADVTLEPGKSVRLHVYYSSKKYLTSGLHTAVIYASKKPLYSGHFSIGRSWTENFTLPTKAKITARPKDERSPYVSSWLTIGNTVRYDAYCVDFKADCLPDSTYCAAFNGRMDVSSLKKQYRSVSADGSVLFYAGLQRGLPSDGKKEYRFILSFWDIFCEDNAGKTTAIRAERTYPAEKNSNDSFGHEGTGAHTLLPYDWQAGRWYRMLLQCGTSKTTGSTTVEQWFQDLTTGEWTHTCTYDTGIKDSCFIGDTALFLENFNPKSAGEVRSMEFTNARIRTVSDGLWRDVTGVHGINQSKANPNAYGSWQAGADENSFYMITTGVKGQGRAKSTGPLTIQNRESGSPNAPKKAGG